MEMSNTSQAKRQRVENRRGPRITGPDRLSNLPEDLILHILSLLPTEATIPTGALGRSWRNLWKEVQHLTFDDKHHRNRFSDHVISALLSYQNRFFKSLTIRVADNCDPTELAIWLGVALLKHVSKLVLRLNELGQLVRFPEGALARGKTLKILKLMGNIILDFQADNVFLECLKEMHLYHVSFQDEASFTRLLGGCPNLEELVLELLLGSCIDNLNIKVPSLQRLILATRYCIEENIVLRTPCLTYLNTRKLDGVESFIIEDASKLREATITHHEEHMAENILSKMVSVQRLSLTAPLKHPRGIIFDLLISLEIETKPASWCILLSHMLTHSPKLQHIKLIGGRYSRTQTSWNEPEKPARCLSNHLYTVMWEDYNWGAEDDRNVAVYILKNAAKLRDATFTTLKPTQVTDVRQRQEMLAQLATVERVSPSSNLIFEDTSGPKSMAISAQDPDMSTFVHSELQPSNDSNTTFVSTISGIHMGSESTTGEDLISKLPEEIIVGILTSLTTEQSISTSILSKRWKSVWKHLPKMVFNHKRHRQRFSEHVLGALLTNESPILHYLKISAPSDCDEFDLATWFTIAFSRNVSKLVLALNNVPEPVSFPAILLRRNNNLKTLKMFGSIMFTFPDTNIHLRYLNKLVLCHAQFNDRESLSRLLHACSHLQELVIGLSRTSGVGIFDINMPTLQRLSLRATCSVDQRLVIRSPQLEYLDIRMFDGVVSCVIQNAEKIAEAKFGEFIDDVDENILDSITTAKHLLISSSMKPPSGKIFHGLTTLELTTSRSGWCRLLSCMLHGSPNLQILRMIGKLARRGRPTWDTPNSIPTCLSTNLTTLVWTNYTWDARDDNEVAKYILQNASHLRKATFSTLALKYHLKKRRDRRLRELTNVARASTSCELVFVYKKVSEFYKEEFEDSDLGEFEDEWGSESE